MRAALLWQASPETPGRLAGCPPSGSFKPRKNQASSPLRAACQPPKKLAGWLAGCPLGPDAQRPDDINPARKMLKWDGSGEPSYLRNLVAGLILDPPAVALRPARNPLQVAE